jgi:SAM-dependent methyltransferase/uncharacterized protein YbaR (Trm112 family)
VNVTDVPGTQGQATGRLTEFSGSFQLACPVCRGSLMPESQTFRCSTCDRTYPLVDGIPILVPDLDATVHEHTETHELGHGGREPDGRHKATQAAYFDKADAEEFEITRPYGTPRLYEFLISEKFRRAIAPIRHDLPGMSVLTVCGGSGMDAEFLARAGARVVSSDLALGAARRTIARARRHNIPITVVVADVERLPFGDASFDLVFVHDGLHHLEDPDAGLVEIARVARRWVSVTEPARAAITRLAVRAGIALEREESGNRVERLAPDEIVDVLRGSGFRPLSARRYAMYYQHKPGRISRALSNRAIFPLVRAAWRLGNSVVGPLGNKLTVVAERDVDKRLTGLEDEQPEPDDLDDHENRFWSP